MLGSVLTSDEIENLIKRQPALIDEYIDLPSQLQVHGFDLTVKEIARFCSMGAIGLVSDDTVLPKTEIIPLSEDEGITISPGSYRITFNEMVNLPLSFMALGRPRSTLLRSGVAIHTAVWDAGYQGRSQALMVVSNPYGYQICKNARLMQLIFIRLTKPLDEGYKGRYQNEVG